MKTCNTDEHECYVVDNNAYVILSDNLNDTGKFFGEVEGAVMDAMVEKDIFKSIDVYDFQALCKEETKTSSDGHSLLNVSYKPTSTRLYIHQIFLLFRIKPIQLMNFALKWIIAEIFWYWSHIQMWAEGMPCKLF